MAVLFNGVNQYLSIAAPRPELASLASYTLCAWIRSDAQPAMRSTAISFSTGTDVARHRTSIGFQAPPPSWQMRTRSRHLDAGAELEGGFWGWSGPIYANKLTFVAAIANGELWPGFTTSFVAVQQRAPGGYVDFGWYSPGAGFGPTSPTATLAAAIGARPDGAAEFFSGRVEDLRLYDRGLSLEELAQLALRRGADRWVAHPDLLFRWRLQGVGPVVTEADQKTGVVATVVNGPVYSAMALIRRRRNRGG